MKQVFPSYYKDFRCIAGDCRHSCCIGWEIDVDPDKLQYYLTLPGPLGDRLRANISLEGDPHFILDDRERCPFLNQNGLCDLILELGQDSLCGICRDHPRFRNELPGRVETGLGLCCEEAARLILETPLEFVTETVPGGEGPEYDGEIMALLQESRPAALALLEDARYTVPQRLRLLLMFGYHIQAAIDGAELRPFDPDAALAEAAQFAGDGDAAALADYYLGLDLLTERWRDRLGALTAPCWEPGLCRIAQYGICRHWFQAVSDWDLSSRVKLLLSGCALAARLPGALRDNAQLWSKEIENSAQNLDALLDDAYSQPALTDANLLGLLA